MEQERKSEEVMYDAIVLGGGAGLSFFRKARECGRRVLLIDDGALGGSLYAVRRGVFYEAAGVFSRIRAYEGYSIACKVSGGRFRWEEVASRADREISEERQRIEEEVCIPYEDGSPSYLRARARIRAGGAGPVEIEASGALYRTPVLVVDLNPDLPDNAPAGENGENVSSFEALFQMGRQPETALILGSDKESVEVASILADLQTRVYLVAEDEELLGSFDASIRRNVTELLEEKGVSVLTGLELSSIERSGRLNVKLSGLSNKSINMEVGGCDLVLRPEMRDSGLAEIARREEGASAVYYIPQSIVDRSALVFMGRGLCETVFGKSGAVSHADAMPRIIYTNPPAGSVGHTEENARARGWKIRTVCPRFRGLFYSVLEEKKATEYKIVIRVRDAADGDTCMLGEEVVGIHIFGDASDQIIQGFALSAAMRIAPADLLRTIPIHPTSAEELITG